MQNREVIEQVEIGYRMPCPKSCPEVLYNEIMLKCWDKVTAQLTIYSYNADFQIPEKRPTFAFLFSFFDDYSVSSQPNYVPPGQE